MPKGGCSYGTPIACRCSRDLYPRHSLSTKDRLEALGLRIGDILRENDACHGLERCGGLIKTGATGTNVNDLSVVLIRPKTGAS